MDELEVLRFQYFLPQRKELLADGKGIQNNLRAFFLGKIQLLPFFAAQYLAARRLLNKKKFHLVNSHWLIPSGLIMTMHKKRFGFKHIITVHAADYYLLRRIPAGKAILRWIISRADALLPVSKAIETGIRAYVPAGIRLRIIPMGADIELFRPPNEAEREKARKALGLKDKFAVLFVGKLSEKKGVEYLIQAAAMLLPHMPELKVLIVGEGHLRETLERMATDAGIAETIQFCGPVPQSELPGYYSASNALVVPSIVDSHGESEGMPVVIIEAMASGLPVIGTTCCAVPSELADAGFIEIKPQDAKQLKKAIEDLKNKSETLVHQRIIRKFSWPETARQYAETFYEIMSKQ